MNSPVETRSGFVCFVGRPNAGKSTLVNAIIGRKIVITSDRPQTTRRTVRGILTRDDGQLVIVDTPGLHKPRTLLGERLNDLVRSTWSEVDAIGLCIPATEKTGPGDKLLASEIAELRRRPVFVILTKTDAVAPEVVATRLQEVAAMTESVGLTVTEFVPVSAKNGDNVEVLSDLLMQAMPTGPALYPVTAVTDTPEETLIAELIREAALAGAREELPHSIAVTVDELITREPDESAPGKPPIVDVHATIHVERESQKPIVIGKGGSGLKRIGSTCRPAIEELLGSKVFLSLHVRVAKEWQRDPKQLRRLGF